ncbi:MAG: hypothetical protein ABW328_16620 [Ilumatobacteraceae bacterium]
MNQPRNTRPTSRRPQQNRRPTKPVDVWRPADPLPDLAPITVPDDVSALLRTLGDPPTAGGDILASYFIAVVERTAAIAAAIALSADLLATVDPAV